MKTFLSVISGLRESEPEWFNGRQIIGSRSNKMTIRRWLKELV